VVSFADQAAGAPVPISVLRRHIGDGAIEPWGFSQGGWVAPLAAATWPDEVAFLTLVSPSGSAPVRVHPHPSR
jgi:pimeloyl-ACP methyl ester carboxylesterase